VILQTLDKALSCPSDVEVVSSCLSCFRYLLQEEEFVTSVMSSIFKIEFIYKIIQCVEIGNPLHLIQPTLEIIHKMVRFQRYLSLSVEIQSQILLSLSRCFVSSCDKHVRIAVCRIVANLSYRRSNVKMMLTTGLLGALCFHLSSGDGQVRRY